MQEEFKDSDKVIRIDQVTHRKLKIKSAIEDKSMGELVESLVVESEKNK